MGKAKQLPSGNWRCRAFNKYTGSTKSFTAPTKKEAERQAHLYYLSSNIVTEITVKEATGIYIQNRVNVLSPNTIKDYRITERLHIKDIEKYHISQLTDTILQKWVNNLAVEHSPKSVKNIYCFVMAVIRSQMPSKRFNVSLPKRVHQDLQMPSQDEVSRIINEIGEPMRTIIELAVYCCLRRGEISALEPTDIHNGYLSIRHSMVKVNGEWVRKIPKTYTSNRNVPCPDFLIERLQENGLPNLNPSEITDRWIKWRDKNGYSFRFHDFRHFSASLMLTVCPKVDVERMGGWQHGSNVLDTIYTYNIAESMSQSAKKWNEKIGELATEVATKKEGLDFSNP